MKNVNIDIKGKKFVFAGEVLFKHIRKIEPLTVKLQEKEIGSFDYMVEIANVLCVSNNKEELEEYIDNMNNTDSEKFMEEFQPIMKNLASNGKKKKK